VDIDSTICDTSNYLIDYLNRTYGYAITISSLTSYRLEDLGAIHQDHIDATFEWFWSLGLISAPALPGAADAISEMAASCRICAGHIAA
jgi:hypothetical protein